MAFKLKNCNLNPAATLPGGSHKVSCSLIDPRSFLDKTRSVIALLAMNFGFLLIDHMIILHCKIYLLFCRSKPTTPRGQSAMSTASPKSQDLFKAPAKRDTM